MSSNITGKTAIPKVGEITRDWVIFDAEGQTLGRLATQIAHRLLGKHKVNFTPHLETGDNVVVVNAEKIVVTGKKLKAKKYYRHSGYWGGLKERTLREMLERKPTEVIEKAVSRMLKRRTRKGRSLMGSLKVYAGPEHPHGAQNPTPVQA